MNFDVLKKGFLPEQISQRLPDEFQDIEAIARNLPKILVNNQIIEEVSSIEPEKHIENLTKPELERAMLLYSYLGHALIWGSNNSEKVIPKNLSRTWHKISKELERPPILSYASYALNNWKLRDESKPFELENIQIFQNFLGGMDEDWFIMIHVAIEYEAANVLKNLKRYFIDKNIETKYLNEGLKSLDKINEIMNMMPDKCDPYVYYNRVRPYIFGWKNNPATPKGVIYEDISEYSDKPQLFRGETGAQSSIVPALDALLGVTHSDDPLKAYLDEMRIYMPKEHRDLLFSLDDWRNTARSEILSEIDKSDNEIITELIHQLNIFRAKHLEYARIYIHEQALSNQSNSNTVGTGGTPFMKYLDKHLQETIPTND